MGRIQREWMANFRFENSNGETPGFYHGFQGWDEEDEWKG
jgi:hypothetical protein